MSYRSVALAALLAASCLCSCTKDSKQLARTHLQHAIEAMERGDYAFALATCEQCAEELPDDRSVHICRLVAAVHLHDWKAALAAAEELRDHEPESGWAAAVVLDLERRLNQPAEHPGPPPAGETGLWACLEGWCRDDEGDEEPAGIEPVGRALLAVAQGDYATAISQLESAEQKGSVPRMLALLYLKARYRAGVIQLLPHLGCRDLVAGELGAQLALFLQERGFFRVPGCPPGGNRSAWPRVLDRSVAHFLDDADMGETNSKAPGADKPRRSSADLLMLQAWSTPPSDRGARLKLLEDAAAADPSNAVANLNLGIALMNDDQLRKAAFYLSRARTAASDPGLASVYLYLAQLLRGNVEVASRMVRELSPSAGGVWLDWLQGLQPHRYFQTGSIGVSLKPERGKTGKGGAP